MGEVETNASYHSPSTTKRPSPSSVAEMLGIVQLQQQPNAPPPQRQNRKGFNNPLPAIGKSSNEPTNSSCDSLAPVKGLSRSFPSPRSLGNDNNGFENDRSPRNDTGMLGTPRGSKRSGATGSIQHQQSRKDANQLPPLSSTSDENQQESLSRSKTTLTRTYSGGETRPRSCSNPRPKSARGIRTRSFHGEASHQRIMAQDASEKTSPRNTQTMGQQVLLTQRRTVASRGSNNPSKPMTQDPRTQLRPNTPSPNTSDGEDRMERPSAPSPPSPGLDSDSESDTEFDNYVANLHRGNGGR